MSKVFWASCLLAALGACADAPLGFGKSPPNAFLVLTYPPLTVPPNIALRAPSDPETIKQNSPEAIAQKMLFGVPRARAKSLSAGEVSFLKRINADRALPNIRRLIAQDRGLAIYPEATTKKIIQQP